MQLLARVQTERMSPFLVLEVAGKLTVSTAFCHHTWPKAMSAMVFYYKV